MPHQNNISIRERTSLYNTLKELKSIFRKAVEAMVGLS